MKKLAVALCNKRLAFLGWIPYRMRANPVGQKIGVLKKEPILVFQKTPINRDALHRKIKMFEGTTL
jgi:hypothetical protein